MPKRTFRTDNLVLPNGKTSLTLDIKADDLEAEIKTFFGWKNTGTCSTYRQRWGALGSHNHDRFVEHLYHKFILG